jgi:hypothetical protein
VDIARRQTKQPTVFEEAATLRDTTLKRRTLFLLLLTALYSHTTHTTFKVGMQRPDTQK